MKKYFIFLLSIMFVMTSVNHSAFARTPFSKELRDALALIKSDTAQMGEPRLEGETLSFGSTKINGDFTLVDSLKAKFGVNATFL